jgi:hypothetical protein
MPNQRRFLVALGLLLLATGCDSRPVVVLGSPAPRAPDAGARASAGREADDDTPTERSEPFERGD